MFISLSKKQNNFVCLIAIFLFIISAKQDVLGQKYGFDVWTTANGLPQNTVTGVVQTPDGYLWISTFDGLARFDGVRFTIFDKGNTKGILNNRFSSIFVDKDGAIWAMTENGVITVYQNGTFTSFQPPETFGSSVGIISDADGNALFEGDERFYYLQSGKFIPTADTKEKNVRLFYYGRSGAKWTLERNGVSRHKDGQTTNYALSLPRENLTTTISFRTYEDNQGALWLAVTDKLYRLAEAKVNTVTKNEIPALKDLSLQTIFDDDEGSVWFVFGAANLDAQVDGQLVRFKDGQFTSYNLGKSVPAGSGITDREGNFWLATTSGLRRLRRQLITALSVKDGLNRNEVYPLLQTAKGDVFIGTVQGVNRYSDGKITNPGLKYESGFPLYMRGLWEDTSARVWLGYQGEGGFGRFEEPSSVRRIGKNDIPNGATDFASDREGNNIWIATEEGLFKYKDDQEIAHYTVKDGLRNDKIITIHFDRNGSLWLGTFDGLSKLKDGKFINYNAEPNSPKGFVRVIYEDAEGVLWFGTYSDGLVRYKDGKFFNYRVEDGLFNNGVFAILEDRRGNFWMSSNRGIHRVSRQELYDYADGKIPKLNSVSYDEKDGMLNAECNGGRIPAAIKTKDDKLWFATMGGVVIIDPEAEKFNPNPPPIVIENVTVDRKPIDTQVFQSAIHNPNSAIEMNPGQSNIAIEYTGLSLIKSGQIKFKYKLEGLEENWVEAGTERTANYSYLPYGTYTFRVIAANANGVWNTESARVKIIVHPFFYQTWWFLILCILAVSAAAFGTYRRRLFEVRRRAAAQEEFSRRLINVHELERRRIAAELHDSLGQSLAFIKNIAVFGSQTANDLGKAKEQLAEISKQSANAISDVREIAYNLRPYLLDRLGLTKAISSLLNKIADNSELDINAEIEDVDGIFENEAEISIYRIIQESLNNILKHAEASEIKVLISRSERAVSIKIQDNGKGFDAKAKSETKQRSGFGLIGMSERVRLLGGSIAVESAARKGTKIEIEIWKQR